MNILVTGARGMVGTALVANLKNIKENKNRTRSNIHIDEIYEYDIDSSSEELDAYCKAADFVFDKRYGVKRSPRRNGGKTYVHLFFLQFVFNFRFRKRLLTLRKSVFQKVAQLVYLCSEGGTLLLRQILYAFKQRGDFAHLAQKLYFQLLQQRNLFALRQRLHAPLSYFGNFIHTLLLNKNRPCKA